MRVLIINGSARGQKGVTHRLLEALGRGLEGGGAQVTALQVRELKVAPCLACLSCMLKTPGVCAQRDDMDRVYALLKESDLLVLGAPVYTDGYPAQLKALMDRCVSAMQPFLFEDEQGWIRHPAAWSMPGDWLLVSTCSFPEPETFAPLIANFRAQARNQLSRPLAEFCLPGSLALQMEPSVLEPHLGHLEEAGRQLATAGRLHPYLLASINRPPLSRDRYLELCQAYEQACRRRLERKA